MKLLISALVVAILGVASHGAEAKNKKAVAPRAEDRFMSAYPPPAETPAFHWSGRSSWGKPNIGEAFPTESANGS